jgi:hypothetical protein
MAVTFPFSINTGKRNYAGLKRRISDKKKRYPIKLPIFNRFGVNRKRFEYKNLYSYLLSQTATKMNTAI